MTTPTPIVVVGIDVGKAYLDAHLLDTGLDCRYANTKSGRRALCNRLRKHRVTRAVFEPTGRYHRQLHQCLAAAGVKHNQAVFETRNTTSPSPPPGPGRGAPSTLPRALLGGSDPGPGWHC